MPVNLACVTDAGGDLVNFTGLAIGHHVAGELTALSSAVAEPFVRQTDLARVKITLHVIATHPSVGWFR
jgi:hypothetical protein